MQGHVAKSGSERWEGGRRIEATGQGQVMLILTVGTQGGMRKWGRWWLLSTCCALESATMLVSD